MLGVGSCLLLSMLGFVCITTHRYVFLNGENGNMLKTSYITQIAVI
jgi:hypothetical protein